MSVGYMWKRGLIWFAALLISAGKARVEVNIYYARLTR